LKGYEDEKEEVSSYLMTLREREILKIERGNTILNLVEN